MSRCRARGPANAFGALAHVRCHLPAVAVEEEGDEYTQTELEKADAEHRPAGYGDVGGGADQLLELNHEGGCVVGQALPIGSEALANHREPRDPRRWRRRALLEDAGRRRDQAAYAVRQCRHHDGERCDQDEGNQQCHQGGCQPSAAAERPLAPPVDGPCGEAYDRRPQQG